MKTPYIVRAQLHKREWENAANLRARLLGERAFPIEVPLDPPTGADVASDPSAARAFIAQWREEMLPDVVVWEERRPRGVAPLDVPIRLRISNIFDLARFLGEDEHRWITMVCERLDAMVRVDPGLVRPSVFEVQGIATLAQEDFGGLCRVLPQLREGMGGGMPLRSLPLEGVDTKFLETHLSLIDRVLDAWWGGAVSDRGGLEHWLQTRSTAGDRMLLVRPLCDEIAEWFRGISALRLGWWDLEHLNPPCTRLLVVENEASVYALPPVPGGLAVGGTGGNLRWLNASWVQGTDAVYWGDMDTDGFRLLAQARIHAPRLRSMLMDRGTLSSARHRGVVEPPSKRERAAVPMEWLTAEERLTLQSLSVEGQGERIRVEQERIDGAVIHTGVHEWLAANRPPVAHLLSHP